jgi:hypothetical protein
VIKIETRRDLSVFGTLSMCIDETVRMFVYRACGSDGRLPKSLKGGDQRVKPGRFHVVKTQSENVRHTRYREGLHLPFPYLIGLRAFSEKANDAEGLRFVRPHAT